MVNAMYV